MRRVWQVPVGVDGKGSGGDRTRTDGVLCNAADVGVKHVVVDDKGCVIIAMHGDGTSAEKMD